MPTLASLDSAHVAADGQDAVDRAERQFAISRRPIDGLPRLVLATSTLAKFVLCPRRAQHYFTRARHSSQPSLARARRQARCEGASSQSDLASSARRLCTTRAREVHQPVRVSEFAFRLSQFVVRLSHALSPSSLSYSNSLPPPARMLKSAPLSPARLPNLFPSDPRRRLRGARPGESAP